MAESLHDRPFSIDNARGDAVYGDVRFVEDGSVKPVVVFCHGFKGFKDWGPFPDWGRALANAGFVAVHFNFSHNGVTPEHPTEFVDLDAFAQNTYTRELADVQAVIDAVAGDAFPDVPVDASRIGLMGHSRGGGIAILQAERDDRVKALATWASVSGYLERFTDEQVRDWKTKGYTEVVNGRTGQVMRLNETLYTDAVEHRDALDVKAAAGRLDVPWLIVHAPDDDAVAFDEAEALHDIATEGTSVLVEAEGGHTFGGSHPHEGDVPTSLQTVWDRTLRFFSETL